MIEPQKVFPIPKTKTPRPKVNYPDNDYISKQKVKEALHSLCTCSMYAESDDCPACLKRKELIP